MRVIEIRRSMTPCGGVHPTRMPPLRSGVGRTAADARRFHQDRGGDL